jgi:hypothetical protein
METSASAAAALVPMPLRISSPRHDALQTRRIFKPAELAGLDCFPLVRCHSRVVFYVVYAGRSDVSARCQPAV